MRAIRYTEAQGEVELERAAKRRLDLRPMFRKELLRDYGPAAAEAFDRANSDRPRQQQEMPTQKAKGAFQRGTMNKIEAAYAEHLEAQKASGKVLWWAFEGLTLKLAKDTRYTPDFAVLRPDGAFEFHETKGFMRDDANVKIKVAAAMFPFLFFLVKRRPLKHGGGWDIRRYGV